VTEVVEVVGDYRAMLGESPVWSVQAQALWWVDIDACMVRRYDPSTDTHEVRTVPHPPGCVGLTADPDVVVIAMGTGLHRLQWSTGAVTPLLDIDLASPQVRFNDGRADPRGRLWVGTLDKQRSAVESEYQGRLFRIDAAGQIDVMQKKVGTSNGLAFYNERMYWADTARDAVFLFDFDPDDGSVANQRLFADFADLPGRPDGACVDEEGCYWIAAVYGSALLRFTPNGRLDRSIALPVSKPSMPAFGGPHLEQLFVTSIGDGGHTQSGTDPLAGALLALDVGVSGIAEPILCINTDV
jgi:L-arabinonolactonase